MFKFSDGTLIEGQADLVETLNRKYSSIKNVWNDDIGAYNLNAYNDNADYAIGKIVFEAGAESSGSKTNWADVLRYWRDRGHARGNDCKLHYFSYTNDTDKVADVYVTVHDYFQNNEISYCDWDGYYVGFSYSSYSSGSSSSSSSSSYDFGGDGDIEARIHVKMNGEWKTWTEHHSSGWWLWYKEWTTTESGWKYENEISADVSDNNTVTYYCGKLKPGLKMEAYISGKDYNALPDPIDYLKVEIIFDTSLKPAHTDDIPEEVRDDLVTDEDCVANDMNLEWAPALTDDGIANDMGFEWAPDITENGVANDLHFNEE